MKQHIQIDFVSDVVCPWCAIGLNSLLTALEARQQEVSVDIRFRPFELTPEMGLEGEEVIPYLCKKYGMTEEQVAENQQTITERGANVGFTFDFRADSRKWNTFDAHRLIHWASASEKADKGNKALLLKHLLFQRYFTENQSISDHAILQQAAEEVGLDATEAAEVLAGDRYAGDVRYEEQLWQERGIRSVPAMVFNEKFLVSGAQPPAAIEQVIDRILDGGQ